MRYRVLAVPIAAVSITLAFSISGFAASSAPLPYDLQLSAPLTSTVSTSKVTSGSTFGGVPVTGTVTGTTASGSLSLYVDGKLFAAGTYSCGSGCTFTGTIAGKAVTGMSLTTASSLTGKTGLTALGKATSSTFANHGGWVSAVAGWANANLTGNQRGQVVSSAAKIEGKLASGKTDPGQASGQASKDKSLNKDQNDDGGRGGGGGKGK